MKSAYEIEVINHIKKSEMLSFEDLQLLLSTTSKEAIDYLYRQARMLADSVYGKRIFIRGLIEFTNYCKNDCYYCGIRCSNGYVERYRLSQEEILDCCKRGYALGVRTFVLQGGEDPAFTDAKVCQLVACIKEQYPDCAVTLSIGEKERESYEAFFHAGADRYLLREETANQKHYRKLHPIPLSFKHRVQCLYDLKEIGYQTGCGFMVGSPGQTIENLYEDLMFIKALQPEMVGIGPFIPQKDTPYKEEKPGTLEQTLKLLSIIRLLQPHALLPATTALETIHPRGRELGILAGANVVMPNLSPLCVRKKYALYDHKDDTVDEAERCLLSLEKKIEEIGYQVVVDRGDFLH